MTLTGFGVGGQNYHMGNGVALAHLPLSPCLKPRLLPPFVEEIRLITKGACDPHGHREYHLLESPLT